MNDVPKTSQAVTIVDRADVEAVLYRVAICAFICDPNQHIHDPGYSIDEDVDWCLAPITCLVPATITDLRNAVRQQITIQTADHQAFIRDLSALHNSPDTAREDAGDTFTETSRPS